MEFYFHLLMTKRSLTILCYFLLFVVERRFMIITTVALWQLMDLGTWATHLGNGCTWAYWANRTSFTQVHELPQSHCGDDREGTWFLWLRIYYVHLASVRFELSVSRGSLMTFGFVATCRLRTVKGEVHALLVLEPTECSTSTMQGV